MINLIPLLIFLITALFWTPPAAAQTSAADNIISESITFRPIPEGPTVYGVFQGRPPCNGLLQQLQLAADPDCIKLKWDLVLFQDPATKQPTTYKLSMSGAGNFITEYGNTYRAANFTGKWTIVKGLTANPNALVYQLNTGLPGTHLYLWKGDENLLFLLDENKMFRVGNEHFSYTLNRVRLVPGKE